MVAKSQYLREQQPTVAKTIKESTATPVPAPEAVSHEAESDSETTHIDDFA